MKFMLTVCCTAGLFVETASVSLPQSTPSVGFFSTDANQDNAHAPVSAFLAIKGWLQRRMASDDGPTMATRLSSSNSAWSFSQRSADNPAVLPIGEGAYQSGKAVEQRTTDKRMHCEQSNWKDCYDAKGDYSDVRKVSASAVEVENKETKQKETKHEDAKHEDGKHEDAKQDETSQEKAKEETKTKGTKGEKTIRKNAAQSSVSLGSALAFTLVNVVTITVAAL
jgi:type IV secretory pathway VirB10-like protein